MLGTTLRRLMLLVFFVGTPIYAFHVNHKSSHRSFCTLSVSRKDQQPTRRDVLSLSIGITGATSLSFGVPFKAHARGLVKFPCIEPLGNTYHFLRAGKSLLEAEDIWSTNPLFVTNREAALSPKGMEQVEATIENVLIPNNVNPSIVRYAIAASSTDTCNIVGRELKLGRDRLVPEFNYLEPRAIGAWDMLSVNDTTKAVWAMDVLEAGPEGQDGRPPPNEDGTPHETLANVATRLRQLLSVMESQYSGDTILVVACDGTTLALLSCMIAGIPYNRVHELDYASGEARLNVNMESTLALWKERQANLGDYQKLIEEGSVNLKLLREMKDIVSLKDKKFEEEQVEMEAEYQRQQAVKRRQEDIEKQARLERTQKIAAENGGESSPFNPISISCVLGIGALGVAVAGGGTDDYTESTVPSTVEEDSEVIISNPLQDEQEMFVPAPPPEERTFDPELDGVDKSSNPLPWAIPPEIAASMEENTGDRLPVVAEEPPVVAEPAIAAAQAMEDYLNLDDGGDEWLQIMAKMAESNEDDDDM